MRRRLVLLCAMVAVLAFSAPARAQLPASLEAQRALQAQVDMLQRRLDAGSRLFMAATIDVATVSGSTLQLDGWAFVCVSSAPVKIAQSAAPIIVTVDG